MHHIFEPEAPAPATDDFDVIAPKRFARRMT